MPTTALVAPPLLSAFKVSAKNGLFLGQMTWVKLDSLEAKLRPVDDLVQENSIGKLR
jgi:hypothetical protein